MSDPITTIATAVAQNAATVASIYGIAKPFLTKILGPAADEIGEIGRDYVKGFRANNANRILADADKLLKEAGREPQPVPMPTLIPLLESASLQDEPTLAERWAALLANAADPNATIEITPSFIDILRQLGQAEIRIIHRLEEKLQSYRLMSVDFRLGSFASSIQLTDEVFGVTVDNLLRLRLCELPPNQYEMGKNGQLMQHTTSKDQIEFTMLGLAFLAAVTPPK